MLLTGVSKFSKVSLFSGLNNLRVITIEESSKAGRLDIAVHFKGRVLVFELKMVEAGATPGGNNALSQLDERGYAEKYRTSGMPVDCIGIEFSRRERTVVAWDYVGDQ